MINLQEYFKDGFKVLLHDLYIDFEEEILQFIDTVENGEILNNIDSYSPLKQKLIKLITKEKEVTKMSNIENLIQEIRNALDDNNVSLAHELLDELEEVLKEKNNKEGE